MRVLVALLLVGCAGRLAPRTAMDRVAYPNGKARFEFALRDGVPNGRGKAWHRNGKLASAGWYRDGARHGQFWLFHEDGTFAAQAIYFDNAEVWRSTDENDTPPAEWGEGVTLMDRPTATDATSVNVEADTAWEDERKRPRPYFSMLDRTTAPARAGAQIGVSNTKELGFGATTRVDVFGHYRVGAYGVFAQLSETFLAVSDDMTLSGRRAAVVAGTHHLPVGPATLSLNAGFIVPLGNVDGAGSVASYAGAEQRPSDAAAAIPAPLSLRSGASLTASRGIVLVQVDAGIDWLLGADERGFDPLGRANIGVGLGSRSTMLTAELANTLHLAGSHDRLQALALGGTLVFPILWVTTSLVFSDSGSISFLGSVGRDL